MANPVCERSTPVKGLHVECGNDKWVRAIRLILDDFGNTRFDQLPRVKAKCTRCGGKRKTLREFVKDGFLTENEFMKKVAGG